MPAVIDQNLCIGCGECANECPMGAIDTGDEFPTTYTVNKEICSTCEDCSEVCPMNAISCY